VIRFRQAPRLAVAACMAAVAVLCGGATSSWAATPATTRIVLAGPRLRPIAWQHRLDVRSPFFLGGPFSSAFVRPRSWQTRWQPNWGLSQKTITWSSDLGFGHMDIFGLAHRFGNQAAPVIEGFLAAIDDHWTEDMQCLSDLVDAGVEFSVAPPTPVFSRISVH